jgi:hypothetical protein
MQFLHDEQKARMSDATYKTLDYEIMDDDDLEYVISEEFIFPENFNSVIVYLEDWRQQLDDFFDEWDEGEIKQEMLCEDIMNLMKFINEIMNVPIFYRYENEIDTSYDNWIFHIEYFAHIRPYAENEKAFLYLCKLIKQVTIEAVNIIRQIQ